MVTKDRFGLVEGSILSYCKQTYENTELLIVTDGSKEYIDYLDKYIESLQRDDIRLVGLNETFNLGTLRNISIQEAKGEIICQWDDDDLNTSNRLEIQFQKMYSEGADISYMSDQLQYFKNEGVLGWVDWSGKPEPYNYIPGTLMCDKSIDIFYPEEGDFCKSGEDTDFAVSAFRKGYKISCLVESGYTYIYTYHGNNTWDYDHFLDLIKRYSVKYSFLLKNRVNLKSTYQELNLPLETKLFYHREECISGFFS